MFDYAGLSERKISRLCSRFFAQLPLCGIPYWTTEVYSIGRYLKEYAGIPQWMPLFVYSQHGINYEEETPKHEIENDAEAMLVFNPDALPLYKRASSKPCYHVTMPYALHRRLHNITQSPDAKGTLVFPFHSSAELDVIFDVDAYVAQLRELPPDFHPLCISLHISDIQKGLHREFIKRGFPVYTAGNTHDVFFGNRVYSLMRHFKYTASNGLSSPAYYSTEMGIPFSLIGEGYELIDVSNPNLPGSRIDYRASVSRKEAVEVFSGIHTRVTPRQKELVHHVLGIGKGLSSEELRRILLDAYRKRRGNAVKDALLLHKRRAKYGFTRFAAKFLDRILS